MDEKKKKKLLKNAGEQKAKEKKAVWWMFKLILGIVRPSFRWEELYYIYQAKTHKRN